MGELILTLLFMVSIEHVPRLAIGLFTEVITNVTIRVIKTFMVILRND
ncbi:hypothetical protein NIES4071_81210 [Calothrix sp. NIES-4071]|nr:hypothetical protein NIES4071_81210 [Calothrix sp. NIES-4071]BAZ62391.1 hypothetical protein NIES4105_81140 [Calothrix sp. NIES-4105]